MNTRQEAESLFAQGSEEFEDGNWKKAIELLQRSIDLDCESMADALFMIGTAQYQSGNSADAKKNLAQCIETDHEYTEAYVNLGLIYGKEGDYVESNRLLEHAVKLGSQYAKQVMQQLL